MSKEQLGLRERQRQLRADAILDAARELVGEVGYEAMTMDALAARVGVTKPTLYAHFPNKEAIAVASIVRNLRQARERMAQLDPSAEPLAQLETIFRWALIRKFIDRNIPVGSAPVCVVRANPEYNVAIQHILDTLCALIDRAKAAGQVSEALDTRTAVQVFISILRDTEYDDLIQSGHVAGDTLVDTLTAMLVRSLRREP